MFFCFFLVALLFEGDVKQDPLIAKNAALYDANKKINEFNKKLTTSKGSRITLTKYEINDIIKVINSLENRATLLKETTEKVINQKGEFVVH